MKKVKETDTIIAEEKNTILDTVSDPFLKMEIPSSVDLEKLRVCRDHAVRCKLELDRIITKMPESLIWRGKLASIPVALNPISVYKLLVEFAWFLEEEYLERAPKRGKKYLPLSRTKHKNRPKILVPKKNHPLSILRKRDIK